LSHFCHTGLEDVTDRVTDRCQLARPWGAQVALAVDRDGVPEPRGAQRLGQPRPAPGCCSSCPWCRAGGSSAARLRRRGGRTHRCRNRGAPAGPARQRRHSRCWRKPRQPAPSSRWRAWSVSSAPVTGSNSGSTRQDRRDLGDLTRTFPSTSTRVRATVSVPSLMLMSDHFRPSTSPRRRQSADSSQHAASRLRAARSRNRRSSASVHVVSSR
jgi:hypothetical protein